MAACKSNISFHADPRGRGRVGSKGQTMPVIVSPPKPLDQFLSYSVYDLLTWWRRARATFPFAPTPGGGAGRGQEVKHCPLLYLFLNCLTDFFHIQYMTSSYDGWMQEQHFLLVRPMGVGQGGVKRSNIASYRIYSLTAWPISFIFGILPPHMMVGCKSKISFCSDPRGRGRAGSRGQTLPVFESTPKLLDRFLS
jgi:hypothetical protein